MDTLMTPVDAAKYLQVPVRNVYRLLRAKTFSSLRVGKLIRIRKLDLDNWIENQVQQYEEEYEEIESQGLKNNDDRQVP